MVRPIGDSFADDQRHGDGVLETSVDDRRFQTWNSGTLILDRPIEVNRDCKLVIDDAHWMFDGDSCIDGLAHGTGRAIREDGAAYINNGTFVLGSLSVGVVVPLTSPDES